MASYRGRGTYFLQPHPIAAYEYCCPDTTKRDERRAEPSRTEPQAKPESPPLPPVLREAVLLAEDAHRPKPQLVPGPHDPHSNLASVRGHEALERHVEASPISCCDRLCLLGDRCGVQCSAPPSGVGQRSRRPAKRHAADGRQHHSRSDLHCASESSRSSVDSFWRASRAGRYALVLTTGTS